MDDRGKKKNKQKTMENEGWGRGGGVTERLTEEWNKTKWEQERKRGERDKKEKSEISWMKKEKGKMEKKKERIKTFFFFLLRKKKGRKVCELVIGL